MPEKSVLSEETQRRISRMSAQHSFGPSPLAKLCAVTGVVVLVMLIWSSFPKQEAQKPKPVIKAKIASVSTIAVKMDAGPEKPEKVDAGKEGVDAGMEPVDAGSVPVEDGRLAKRLAELAKKSQEVHQRTCAALPNVSIEVMQKDRILFAKFGFDLKLAIDFAAEKTRIDPNADKFLRSRTAEVILIRRLCGQLERAQDPQFVDAAEKTRKTLASLRAYVQ